VGKNDNIDVAAISPPLEHSFVFMIRDPTGVINSTYTGNGYANGRLNSRGFLIINSAQSSSSSSSSSSSATSNTSPSSTTDTSAKSSTPVSSSPASPASSGGNGLNQAEKIGIGVGAGVGGLLLIALSVLATMFFMRSWRRHRDDQVQHQDGQMDKTASAVEAPNDSGRLRFPPTRQELSGASSPAELPSYRYVP
jgi:hypothetical protein